MVPFFLDLSGSTPAPSIHHQEIPGEDEGPGPSTTSPPWAPVPNACSVHPKCHESFGDSKRNNETVRGKKKGRAYQNNNQPDKRMLSHVLAWGELVVVWIFGFLLEFEVSREIWF